MKLKHYLLGGLLMVSIAGFSNPVIVKMNSVSKTMSLAEKESGKSITLPSPNNQEYSIELNPGDYVLTAYATDGTTKNGTIVINVTDSTTTQQYTIITCTAYVTNKHDDGSNWSVENNDYKLNVSINTREGVTIEQTPGKSITDNRYTFLALNGNSYNVAFIPCEQHRSEGFMTLYRNGTLTANVNVSGAIPVGGDYSITVPSDANLELGMKFTHFTDFTPVKPTSIENTEGGKKYNFVLANGQIYNYRTWKTGGLTHGGYFTMNTTDSSKCPVINFTEADYAKADHKAINHSPQSNNGYETGDLLLNINPEHHLKLNVGEEFLVHGMRMWELTDNSTNNYLFEPDFHYTVYDTNFKPSNDVIEIENSDTNTSAWSTIRAKGIGTAIVMVTYDGINLNYYNNADKKEYLGGEYWGAIWPENTGVFVVSVGETGSDVVPNMTVNEKYNMDALRLAGNNVDAEHDVFYYLDTEEGYRFTFTPEGATSITIASPQVSETEMKYSGFTTEGVTKNEDGSYTLLLKMGKTIVKMTDAAGRSTYQVLRAKPCHREITNQTRPGSNIFQPGDKVKIQYSGLFHPANKIAGIYNMSAYVTYNGTPNGSSLILGSGQYTFGSAASAQAVTLEIPDTLDVMTTPVLLMNEGVIQVNGYGDPIGNHRNTSPIVGRSPNFTAVPHKTYFGAIPDIQINLNPVKYFNISLTGLPVTAELKVYFEGKEIEQNEAGIFNGTFGTYSVVANAEGYKCYRNEYTIGDDSSEDVVFSIEMQPLGNAWDGKTKKEPQVNEEGSYLISNGAELAWFADKVNSIGGELSAELVNDIELGNFEWSPIGTSSKSFSGKFNGNGHSVSEIYVNNNINNQGLFGYVNNGHIEGVIVFGSITGKQYVGGLAGNVLGESTIDRCANYADVKGSGTYVGGLIGYLNSAKAVLSNCYNVGKVSGTTNCGGVIGNNNASATMTNIFNVGDVIGTTVGSCVGGTTAKNNLTNAFTTKEYQITTNQTLVSSEQMSSGEIAYKLGDAFTQTIGEDQYPVFDGLKVYYDDVKEEYYNLATGFDIEVGNGSDSVMIEEGIIVMHVNDTYCLSIAATPENARLPEIKWCIDKNEIASVNEGIITALAKGEGVISASATINDNLISKTCSLKVIGAIVTELHLNQKELELDLNENPTFMLTAAYWPDYADEPLVVWSSDNENVITVAHNGSLTASIKAVNDGEATIKVHHAGNQDVFDTCDVKVTSTTALIENIFCENGAEKIDIFDIQGRIIRLNANAEHCKLLAPGLYIIKYNDTVKHIIIK